MKKICCSVLLSSLFFASLEALTLEEAVVAAFRNNQGWEAAKTQKKETEARAEAAMLSFLPSVNAELSSTRGRTDRRDTNPTTTEAVGGVLLRQVPNPNYGKLYNTESTATTMQLKVEQNLFNGFATTNSFKAAKLTDEANFHALRSKEQELVLKVIKAYTEVWFSRKALEARKKMMANMENTLRAQQSKLEAGTATTTEVADAESKFQRSVSAVINAETELMSAEAEFLTLTGLNVDDNMMLPDLKFDLPKSFEVFMKDALLLNSDIKAKKLQEQSASKGLSAQRGVLSPSVNARLIAYKQLAKRKVRDVAAYPDEFDRTYQATLSVNVPIFENSNGNTYSKIEIANQQALRAKFEAEDKVLEVKRDCIVNWNKYKSAIAMIQSSRSAVKHAELSSEGNMEELALGMKSNTDVWTTENDLLESRINLAKSQKEKVVAAATLLSLTGNLTRDAILKRMRK